MSRHDSMQQSAAEQIETTLSARGIEVRREGATVEVLDDVGVLPVAIGEAAARAGLVRDRPTTLDAAVVFRPRQEVRA